MNSMNKMACCFIILIAALYITQSDAIQRPTFIDRLNHLINKRSTEASTCLTNAFNDYKQAVQRALLKHNTDIQTELQKHNTHQRELRRYNHALKQALQKYNTTIDACNTPPPPTTTAVACLAPDQPCTSGGPPCCNRYHGCVYNHYGRRGYNAPDAGGMSACYAAPPSCVAGRTDCTCF
ncbi:unnamed protein product [Adineta steineri]|uniref:Uncharacterized protein n=1 Tax=Adineta steineri TaxID=433720 RepID=A0A819IAU0_9BILA|nr:unnamed protein product [Adineta steineri]CAF3915971.1 unnamed protein product [Adineta steineri]